MKYYIIMLYGPRIEYYDNNLFGEWRSETPRSRRGVKKITK